jgi:hypothetical protein
MATRILMSTFTTQMATLLQGIPVADISVAGQGLAVRQALKQYNRDVPRRCVTSFAGDGGRYYLMYGYVDKRSRSDRDASIDLQNGGTGVDEKLGIKFTLAYDNDLHQIDLLLSRVGATIAGTLAIELYTADTNGRPDKIVATSESIDIDGVDGPRQGIFDWIEFSFDPTIRKLPAGDYCAVLTSSDYTYVSGTTEVNLGVDQSDITNDVATYDGATWTDFGTDSKGILRVVAGVPGWRIRQARIISVEYPAANIDNDEVPMPLDNENFNLYESEAGWWLYFPGLSPPSTESIRLEFTKPYIWTEATDPSIDTPAVHTEAICCLASSFVCLWLAVRYGQNSDSVITADIVDQRSQSQDYRTDSQRFYKTYRRLLGLDRRDKAPALAIRDLDLAGGMSTGDFIFHTKGKR